ncbi:family 16 putative glycoside hydrolase [Cladorrhinum sp. PSN259]|nr:family 16 putative glycoside hydrolase [Cladorrhinum sp. PSN259]
MAPSLTKLGAVALAYASGAVAQYSLKEEYTPSNFFSKFEFKTFYGYTQDPNRGHVWYRNQADAEEMGLINKVNVDDVYIGVNHKDSALVGRSSVRIESNNWYSSGLFIAEFSHLPGLACGAWPAFWLNGETWPSDGEVDIYEGWNYQGQNKVVSHTNHPDISGKCHIDRSASTGSLEFEDCYYKNKTQPDNAGCAVSETNSLFANPQGGVWATEWKEDSIKVWSWPRGLEPPNVKNGNPNPSSWGTPSFALTQDSCEVKKAFKRMRLILNINFCGDAAGNTWGQDCRLATGVSSCSDYVKNNAAAFKEVYWKVKGIKVYQLPATSSSSTISTSTTSSSSSSTTSSSTTTTTSSSTVSSSTVSSTTSSSTSSSTSSAEPTSESTTASETETASTTETASETESASVTETATATATITDAPDTTSDTVTESATATTTAIDGGDDSDDDDSCDEDEDETTTSATVTATATETETATETSEPTETASETETATATETTEPTETCEPTETVEPTETASETETATATETTEPTETAEPTGTVTASETGSASVTETIAPTETPVPTETETEEFTTSTLFETKTLTITSCAPSVTSCPGRVVTSIIPIGTTVCPVTKTNSAPTVSVTPTESPLPTGYTTSTLYSTKTLTITSCAPTVTNCPGRVVTSVIPIGTTICPIGSASSGVPVPEPSVSVSVPVPGAGGSDTDTTTTSVRTATSTTVVVVPRPSSSTAGGGADVPPVVIPTLVPSGGIQPPHQNGTFSTKTPTLPEVSQAVPIISGGPTPSITNIGKPPVVEVSGAAAKGVSGLMVIVGALVMML